MESKSKYQPKRCVCCGRYFVPDRRVGERQKCCQNPECRQKRKGENRQRWRAGRRAKIQDQMPPQEPLLTLRLVVPVKWFKGEIQDEIRFVRQCGCGFFVSGDRVQDTRPDSHPSSSGLKSGP